MASKTRRPQTPKARNEDWMRARLEHSNRNLTVPSGKKYKRTVKHRTRQFQEV
jgi:hypothetical protein